VRFLCILSNKRQISLKYYQFRKNIVNKSTNFTPCVATLPRKWLFLFVHTFKLPFCRLSPQYATFFEFFREINNNLLTKSEFYDKTFIVFSFFFPRVREYMK